MFEKYDRDGNGSLDRKEALRALKGKELTQLLGQSELAPETAGFDFTGKDLKNVFDREFRRIYNTLDQDGSGTVDWKEWRQAFDSLVDPDPDAGLVAEKEEREAEERNQRERMDRMVLEQKRREEEQAKALPASLASAFVPYFCAEYFKFSVP